MSEFDKTIKDEATIDRWHDGLNHHPKSIRLMNFLKEIDFKNYGDFFCWKTGGDGDNGETLMYQLDAYFYNDLDHWIE